jgi:hypothetical protein
VRVHYAAAGLDRARVPQDFAAGILIAPAVVA